MFIINPLNLYPLSKIGFHFPPHTFYVSSQHIMIQLILYVEPGEVIEAFVCRKILPEGFEAHPVRIDQRKGIMPVVACAEQYIRRIQVAVKNALLMQCRH